MNNGTNAINLTYNIPGGPSIRVYDNGGASFDRYTVVIENDGWDDLASYGNKMMLGLHSRVKLFSNFTEGREGSHLGQLIDFNQLDSSVKDHIIRRLENVVDEIG